MGESEAQLEGKSSIWIGTSNRGFGKLAMNELSRLFGKVKTQSLSPGDVYRFEVDKPRDEALATIRAQVPIFLRHLQPVNRWIDAPRDVEESLKAITESIAEAGLSLEGRKVAVQARKAEGATAPIANIAPVDVKRAIDGVLEGTYGAFPTVQDMEFIISVYLTREATYIGWSAPEDNLSTWSGGAVHFQKENGDISRAKFKLMEAELVFGLNFGDYHSALDLGAAPGGWSSFLLEKGLRVTAVDPAELHPSLVRESGLTYLQKNAADVEFPADEFDLLVCDMSWDPVKMAELVKRLLPSVSANGLILTTVKLLHGKAFATLRQVEAVMEPVAELVSARQLFHNREEITCLWRKK